MPTTLRRVRRVRDALDNIESRVLTNWHMKKSNVERTGLQHLYPMRRGNCAQRELYFGIQLPMMPKDKLPIEGFGEMEAYLVVRGALLAG